MKTLFSYLWITGLMTFAIFQLSVKIYSIENLSDLHKGWVMLVLISGLVLATILSVNRIKQTAINDFIKGSKCLEPNRTEASIKDIEPDPA